MSKLAPIVKQQVTAINRLINFVNEVKPYHTKILDTHVTFTMIEDVFVNITEMFESTVDLLLDNPMSYTTGNIVANIGLMEPHGFNTYGYGIERYDARAGSNSGSQIDTTGPNTLNTSITEYLIVDKTRTIFLGLGYESFNELDVNGDIVLPVTKVSTGPVAVGTFSAVVTFSSALSAIVNTPNTNDLSGLSTPVANSNQTGFGNGEFSQFMTGGAVVDTTSTVTLDSMFNQM
jgi:hypothetical protein